MYNIDKKSFGYQLTFSGDLDPKELKKWISESKKLLNKQHDSFNLVIDMRHLHLLSDESESLLSKGQTIYKEHGLNRSVVLYDEALISLQCKAIARLTDILNNEKYIDVEIHPNYKKLAMDWLKQGIDPDESN